MPPPAKLSLLPFIKELFFNKQSVVDYIKRNRLITGLFIAVVILVFVNLFITEQAIRLSNSTQNNADIPLLQKEIIRLKTALIAADTNANALNECIFENQRIEKLSVQPASRCPTPAPRPLNHSRDPVIITTQRDLHEDSLRKKLDAIRVE